MKLYFSNGSCSLSPHIVLREAGLPFEMEKVDLKAKKTESGKDFVAISPKGYVPTLQLDNGEVLTEGAVMVQYIASLAPQANLTPKAGTMDYVRMQEWLNFVATELHKMLGGMFNPAMPESYKDVVKGNLAKRLDYLNQHLAGKQYIMGNQFTVVDAYCFTVLNWCKSFNISLEQYPNITALNARVTARPAVQAAMQAEGLLKKAA